MFRFGDPGGRVYTALGTSNVNVLALWTTLVASNGALTVQTGGGRLTGSCLRFSANGNGSATVYLTKSLDAQATWGCAFALKINNVLPSTTAVLAAFNDGATSQVDLRLNADGSLSVTRGGTVLGSTAAGLVGVGAWVHLEFKALIHPSAGTAQVWVAGVSKLSLTSQNTRASANSSANIWAAGLISGTWGPTLSADVDDAIVYDGQATDAAGNADITGPIGDCGLSWLLPTGAGTTTQFTPDTGSNYARVNEATPDLTSYVESSTVGQKDTYALADLAAGSSAVKSVAVLHYARKTDVGSRQMGAVIRSGGTDYTHATGVDLSDSYAYSFRNWGSNPNGGTAWTATAVNALEIGQIVNA